MQQSKESNEKRYPGMHNGTVSGKGFEKSRRARKSHAERRAGIVSRSSGRSAGPRK